MTTAAHTSHACVCDSVSTDRSIVTSLSVQRTGQSTGRKETVSLTVECLCLCVFPLGDHLVLMTVNFVTAGFATVCSSCFFT